MMTMSRCLLGVLFLAAMTSAWAEQDPVIQKDLTYGHAGGVDLKLDLAVPPAGDGPFPILVFIHGGGWAAGSKLRYETTIAAAAKLGYVAATVEYRFAPRFRFPAQIEDVKCAVRYLRAHAKELKADAGEVGAIGESAGGHLALLLGLMDPKDGLEGDGGWADQPSKVQAVVNYFGPTDLRDDTAISREGSRLLGDLLGTPDQHAPIAAQASPIVYLDKDDAPVLTFHGGKDPLVPVIQAHHLHEALKQAGVEEHLEIFEQAGHGFGGKDAERATAMATEFLGKHLQHH
jgi:acetyl esterase/lipase